MSLQCHVALAYLSRPSACLMPGQHGVWRLECRECPLISECPGIVLPHTSAPVKVRPALETLGV